MDRLFIKTNSPGSLLRRIYSADTSSCFAGNGTYVAGNLLTAVRKPGGVEIKSDALGDIAAFLSLSGVKNNAISY